MTTFAHLIAILLWLAGIVIAKGTMVYVAALFPPYAWYLIVERVMAVNGWS
mgnify:CR=1 FL=1